jgi:capsular exopolysaccharide synthesis family protein
VIVAMLAVALAIGWATTSVAHVATKAPVKQYSATTLVLNTGVGNSPGFTNLQTLATLTTIPTVAKLVATDLHYSGDPQTLANSVSAQGESQTGLLSITATSTDPKQAKLLADTFAVDLLTFLRDSATTTNTESAAAIQKEMTRLNSDISRLDNQIVAASGAERDQLTSRRNAEIVAYNQLQNQYQNLATQAVTIGTGLLIIQHAVPQQLVSTSFGLQPPRTTKTRLLLAAIVGLIAGIALALVLERFDTRIRNKRAAEKSFGLPVLAEIPLVPRLRRWRLGNAWRGSRGVPVVMPAFPRVGDAFRLLGAGVSRGPLGNGSGLVGEGNGHHGSSSQPSGVILVTSAGPSEGKTTVVANLALTFVQAQRSVIILSCDFQHPQIHQLFGVPNTDGLADALQAPSGAVLNGHIKSTPVRDMRMVPSGARPKNPAGLFSSERMRQAIEEARREADIVLLDSPPLLTSAEITHLFPMVDSVLIVARAKKTTQELGERAGELLKRLDAPVVGVALNGVTEMPLPSSHEKYWQVMK